jgi:hypothetical protein
MRGRCQAISPSLICQAVDLPSLPLEFEIPILRFLGVVMAIGGPALGFGPDPEPTLAMHFHPGPEPDECPKIIERGSLKSPTADINLPPIPRERARDRDYIQVRRDSPGLN